MKPFTLLIGLLFISTFTLQAQKSEPAIFSTDKGAIKGYDPVAYFTLKQPLQGKADITSSYKDATFHFSTKENKETFDKNPEKYAPQYGGYCAWAVAKGYTAPTDPFSWAIVDDKLYLNYSSKVQKKWDKDREGFIQKANANYPGLIKE